MSRTQIVMSFAGSFTGTAVVAAVFGHSSVALFCIGVAILLVAVEIIDHRR